MRKYCKMLALERRSLLAPCSQRVIENVISSLVYTVLLVTILICQFKLHRYGIQCTYQESTKFYTNNSTEVPSGDISQPTVKAFQFRNDSEDGSSKPQHFEQTDQSNDHRHVQNGRKLYRQRTAQRKPSSLSGLNNTQQYQSDQSNILDKCCACDEAKYELIFEGLWSRYTHPENFPENYWMAYFSDVIGASHSNEFKMWAEDQFASEGVKELAQSGSTKKLEAELKQVSSKIRTIIKARELRYPILNSRTFAVFRTDNHHHLVSLLSKLGPSPDWMVGVSGLELCQPDCTWAMQKVVNLHLWDAGTDSGESFTAPDSPKVPQDTIRPFRRTIYPQQNSYTAENTNHTRSINNINYVINTDDTVSASVERMLTTTVRPTPAYVSSNEPLKPFGRLIITRQRIYEKACSDYQEQDMNSSSSFSINQGATRPETDTLAEYPVTSTNYADCRFTDWSDWSMCSSTCGRGIRTRIRSFINDHAYTSGCSRTDLIEKEVCLSECVGNTTCVTKDWSDWSDCSVNCGQGYRQRSRGFIAPFKRGCTNSVELVEREPCMGNLGMDCNDETADKGSQSSGICRMTDWSAWSECSAPCGRGTKVRTRQYTNKEGYKLCSAQFIQRAACTGKNRPEDCANQAKEICSKGLDVGPCRALVERWSYDKLKCACVKFQYGGCLGNKNNFETCQDCEKMCLHQNNTNIRDRKGMLTNFIAEMSKECWFAHISYQYANLTNTPNLPIEESQSPVDCILGPWSPWSACSSNCKRTRQRKIIQRPRNGGKPCDRGFKTQRCKQEHRNTNCSVDIDKHSLQSKGSYGRQNVELGLNYNRSKSTKTTTTTYSYSMDDEDEDS